MDTPPEQDLIKACIKCEHYLYDSLNVVYNPTTCTIVLWNKYQIFIYEDRNMNTAAKLFVPEFCIQQLVLSNNYILCLDTNRNVHAASLKFKNPSQKRLKGNFQHREQNTLILHRLEDHTLSLKYEKDEYYLCFHRINIEYQLEQKVKLKYKDKWPLPKPVLGKSVLASYKINESELESIKQLYNIVIPSEDYSIVLFSFDKLTIYSCLYSSRLSIDDVSILKIYVCPSEICNIEVKDDLTVIIFLTSGTLMRFSLKEKTKLPQIVHLNTAIHNYLLYKDVLLYTDGLSLWKTDKTFSDDVTFHQFAIKQVKDFVKYSDQLVCTTYSNLIYILPLDDSNSYIKSSSNEYCSAEKLLNNSEYLYKILEEIERNNDMVKKLKEEGNYITALSLSNRQDIMESIIRTSVLVYEDYIDVIRDHSEFILTDEKSEYFESEILIFTNITTITFQHMFNSVISDLFDNLMIHITIFTNSKLLKSTSIKLKEPLRTQNILISVNPKNVNISELNVLIKLVSTIPGCHDQKQPLWNCLYRKHVYLGSEHFIKSNRISRNKCLKNSEDIESFINKSALNNHKQLFKFIDATKYKGNVLSWSFYLKLPENYNELLKDNYNSRYIFHTKKSEFLLQQYASDVFLESKNELLFEIGNEKVKIQIDTDFSIPLLKVCSENICIAFNIRNFFSKLIYNDFNAYNRDSREYVKYTLYNIAENLQKELKAHVQEARTIETFMTLAEQFERNIIGSLPI